MSDQEALLLTLPARAENMAVVRQALAGLAEALEIGAGHLADIKVATSEACNNVVLHAYPDGEGPMEVRALTSADRLRVIVRDEGTGLQPRAFELPPQSLGLGLPLMSSLSSGFSIRGGPGAGLEVRLEFELAGATQPEDRVAEEERRARGEDAPVVASVEMEPGPALAPVLSRVITSVLSQTGVSLDRLSDAQLLGDAISAHAPRFMDGDQLKIELGGGDDGFDLRVGPLVPNGAAGVVESSELPGMGRVLECLADEVVVEDSHNGAPERLVLRLGRS